MLNKNIYLLYPAGYHGNYIKWSIEVSDALNDTIVKNPINASTSQQLGGKGTSHNHPRVPTHQKLRIHDLWYIFNRPQDYRVYLINTGEFRPDASDQIAKVLIQDPTGIVINLHDDDDNIYSAYGRINCVTKWPTFMAAMREHFGNIHPCFDPFNCAQDLEFRNFIVKKNPLGSCGRPDIGKIKQSIYTSYYDWFLVRNRYQPHEVNHETYPGVPDVENRFFNFSLKEILSLDFPQKLHKLLEKIEVIDTIDITPVENVHPQYVDIQPNLQWFHSINQWQISGKIDHYLTSHSIIEAELILQIFQKCGIFFESELSEAIWLYDYNKKIRDPSWPILTDPQDFYTLPQWIRDELIEKHNFMPRCSTLVNDVFSGWEQKTVEEINDIYQGSVQKQA